MINWNGFKPAAESCYPCDCVDSLIRKGKELESRLAELQQYRTGHLPSCGGSDPSNHECACGYLQGYAYRELYDKLADLQWRLVEEAKEGITYQCCTKKGKAYMLGSKGPSGRWLSAFGYTMIEPELIKPISLPTASKFDLIHEGAQDAIKAFKDGTELKFDTVEAPASKLRPGTKICLMPVEMKAHWYEHCESDKPTANCLSCENWKGASATFLHECKWQRYYRQS